MSKLTCTEKAWDNVRPSSVKKTGLSEAIKQTLKVLPGGDPQKLTTLAECDKARLALTSLQETLKSAHTAVAKAKDDKKDAAALLKEWQEDTAKVASAVVSRQFTVVEDILDPTYEKWTEGLKNLERSLVGFTGRLRDAEQNKGHSENQIQQAAIAMVERAGEMAEQGVEVAGKHPKDLLGDKQFKEAYGVWQDMVRMGLQSTKEIELLISQLPQVSKLIDLMCQEVAATEKAAGEGMQLESAGIRRYKVFMRQVADFRRDTREGSQKYMSIAMIQDPKPDSRSFEAEADKALVRLFAKLKASDAKTYLQNELDDHGLSLKQLQKTLLRVKGAEQQLRELQQTLGKSGGNQTVDPKAVQQLQVLAGALNEIEKRLVKSRQNLAIIQALDKGDPRTKQQIDLALAYVKKVTQEAGEESRRYG